MNEMHMCDTKSNDPKDCRIIKWEQARDGHELTIEIGDAKAIAMMLELAELGKVVNVAMQTDPKLREALSPYLDFYIKEDADAES